jgi:hypothetical protein
MNLDLPNVVAFIRRLDRLFPTKVDPGEFLDRLEEKWGKEVIGHLLDIENKKPVSKRIKILAQAAITLALGNRKIGERK